MMNEQKHLKQELDSAQENIYTPEDIENNKTWQGFCISTVLSTTACLS